MDKATTINNSKLKELKPLDDISSTQPLRNMTSGSLLKPVLKWCNNKV